MARQCIFCRRTPGSGEHLFSDWLNQLFPVDKKLPKPEWARHTASGDQVTTRVWTASDVASETTNMICHDCNTGWMSSLEARAKPLLCPLIRGEQSQLTQADQLLITTWAVKTAMVIEATLSDRDDNFTPEECAVVMHDDRPPASVEIAVAGVEGEIAPMHYACAKVGMELGNQILTKFHSHTIQVGALVLNILRRDPPPANYGSLERLAVPRELDVPFEVATMIFPPRGSCKWPPAKVLDWTGLDNLTRRGLQMPREWAAPDPLAGPFQRKP